LKEKEEKTLKDRVMGTIDDSEDDWQCQGIQTEHHSELEGLEFIRDDHKLVKQLIDDIGEDLLQWLLDLGFLSERIPDCWSWGKILQEFEVSVGVIKTCKCRKCKGTAIEVEDKFHCSSCGHIFDETVCPDCGGKLDYGRELDEEGRDRFAPFWTCPCGYNTEAATYG